ncbi:DUF427 domain-containing protein [soil metagenome]
MSNRVQPQEGQESVWDYPRPPRVEPITLRVRVVVGDVTLADSINAVRVLETSHPPVYYLPQTDIMIAHLTPTERTTFCEFKGAARYWTLRGGDKVGDKEIANVAWSYPNPARRFETIRDHLAFYPSKVDACYVGDERVQAQADDFYGGWITENIVGPFKGGPGTGGW